MQLSSVRPPSLAAYPSYLAAQMVKSAHRMLLERLAAHELRLHHFAVLACLDDFGALCQQDLCDRLDIDKSHVVGFVDDLTERRFVGRTRDPEDRRRYRLSITEDGRAMLANLHEAESTCQELLLGSLRPAERTVLLDLLGRVVGDADRQRLGSDEVSP